MDKNQAIKLIQDTFQSPFEDNRFKLFIKNLLKKIEETPSTIYRGNIIPDSYEPYIQVMKRIGKYTDNENNRIDILVIHLKKETSLERARSMQRNFIAWYLNGSRGGELKDAALVAFISPDQDDWRFSLVKMDYKFTETAAGKVKVKEEFTPARRFSFLVGENESSHTAQSKLVPYLEDDSYNPTLKDMEESFNIEKVTKEFFEKYRNLFLEVKECLDEIVKKDKAIQKDFEDKVIDTVDFSKKLLGQIVFLYFLQKKGWFGVERDKDWGTGSKRFLRELFEKKHGNYKNFFNDILEPLFYESLAKERDDNYYKYFNCKIPFLNGGLFDPINDYDWVHTDILLPNELFANDIKTKEGDAGTGILDIFDRYNFTVKEDEPLEKEVAIDPEMLGKVFENLLEVKDRKSKGTYYTPREIVHYMCQESLVNYLSTELSSSPLTGEGGSVIPSKEDIEILIRHGESAIEHDARVEQKGKETRDYSYKLPEGIRNNAKLIDDKLTTIRICDPAVGSGAFLVGMMNEIVRARNVLTAYLSGCHSESRESLRDEESRSPVILSDNEESRSTVILSDNEESRAIYSFKRHSIHNCLYGVDIDPGAVEIAKLRLWLSLVVDEEDIKQIKPLPNLDYKIMQGNSLLEEYEGIKLFDENLITPPEDNQKQIEEIKTKQSVLQKEYLQLHSTGNLSAVRKQQIESDLNNLKNALKNLMKGPKTEDKPGLFDYLSEAKKKSDELNQLHKDIFNVSQKSKKDELKKKIEKLEWDLIEATLKEQKKESSLKKLEQFKKSNVRPFFLWKLNFSEVFQEKGGFDVVIANPPYMKERGNKIVFEPINSSYFGKMYHQGKMDYWYYFLHKAIDISKKEGVISYITSRYWLNSAGASKLIKRVKDELSFINFVDIGKLKVFDEVAGHHMVAVYSKRKNHDKFVYKKLENNISDIDKDSDTDNLKIIILSNKNVFSDNDEIILENNYQNIDKVITLGSIIDISQGVVEATDKISHKQFNKTKKRDICVGDGVFVLNQKELVNLKLSKNERSIIKKYLDPNDVYRYGVNWQNKYLIYSDGVQKKKIETDNDFINLRKHLNKYKEFISSSNKPYGLHRSRDLRYFINPKIIFKCMFVKNDFAYDEQRYFVGFSFSLIIQKDTNYSLKYILAILNSKVALDWFYKNGKKRGAGVDIGVKKLRSFPIETNSQKEQKPFIDLVDKILAITKDDDYLNNSTKQSKVKEYEHQIDHMVYKLYDLTEEEIKIIEGST